MTKIQVLLLSLIFFVPQVNNLSAQNNSRFELTLNDGLIASLKSIGSLQAPLSADAQGKVAAIQIQFAESASEPASNSEAAASVTGNACQILIDDAMIELARKQPVRIALPEGAMFSRVFLNYDDPFASDPPPPTATNSAPASANATNLQPTAPALNDNQYFQHFVKLTENKTIMGQMDLAESIKFETKFGEVEISVGQIAGIRFHVDGEDAALVVLKNGDSITGVPQTESFKP